jgi:hypothetical protein
MNDLSQKHKKFSSLSANMKYLDLLAALNQSTFPSSENFQTHIKQNCQNQSLFKKNYQNIPISSEVIPI